MTTSRSSGYLTLLGCFAILAAQAAAIGVVLFSGERGPVVLRAVGIASAVTGSGSLAGWLVARFSRTRSPAAMASGGLAATTLRLFPALLALGWISALEPDLAKAGAAGLLVSFYLTMLVVAILLHLLETREGRSSGEKNKMI